MKLYNNISLSENWPPRVLETTLDKPVGHFYEKPDVINVKIGRQLFVDDFLIKESTLERTYHQPKVRNEAVFYPETQLELNDGYCSCACPFNDGIFYDEEDKVFKMWYHAGWFDGVAYAESKDGIHWKRLHEIYPDRKTDRVLEREFGTLRDGAAVWLDYEAKNKDEKFKMIVFYRKFDTDFKYYHLKPKHSHDRIGSTPPVEQTVLYKSANGIDWTKVGITTHTGDNTTFFYNPFRKKWVFSTRKFSSLDQRVRVRGYIEKDDILNGYTWNKEEEYFWNRTDIFDYPDPELGYYTQLYGLDATPYESIMLGVFSVFMGPPNNIAELYKTPKFCNLKIAYSRDGFSWDRGDYSDFLASSKKKGSFNCGYLHPVNGILNVVNDEIYFYFSAFTGISPNFGFHKYSGGNLCLATLRRDGFVSLDAKEEGYVQTEKLEYNGDLLFVNADSSNGVLYCEVLDENGNVIEGYSKSDCKPVSIDNTKINIKWVGNNRLPKNKIISLKFYLEQSELYSFWISDHEEGKSYGYMAAGGPGFHKGKDQ